LFQILIPQLHFGDFFNTIGHKLRRFFVSVQASQSLYAFSPIRAPSASWK